MPAISDYFLVPPSPPVLTTNFPKPECKPNKPPSYCEPCLFYGGDLDASAPNPNGLWNGLRDTSVPVDGEVLVPFTVPKGQIWIVTGLFTNNQSSVSVIDPQQANWSISKDVTGGSAGHTIASGTAHASYTPTGRSFLWYKEYTVLVKIKAVLLVPRTYWLTVVPLCTNPADSTCNLASYYESDAEDNPPLNYYGPLEPNDMSYFNSAYFGYSSAPTWGGLWNGCHRFSAGVLGFAL